MTDDVKAKAIKDQFDAAVRETQQTVEKMLEVRGDELHQDYISFEDQSTPFKQRMGRWTHALKEGRIASCEHVSPHAPQPVFASMPLIDTKQLTEQGVELPDWIKGYNDVAILVCTNCIDAIFELTIHNNICDGCGRTAVFFYEATVTFGPVMLFGNLCEECMRENNYETR